MEDFKAVLLKVKTKRRLGSDASVGQVYLPLGSVFGEDDPVIEGHSFAVRFVWFDVHLTLAGVGQCRARTHGGLLLPRALRAQVRRWYRVVARDKKKRVGKVRRHATGAWRARRCAWLTLRVPCVVMTEPWRA